MNPKTFPSSSFSFPACPLDGELVTSCRSQVSAELLWAATVHAETQRMLKHNEYKTRMRTVHAETQHADKESTERQHRNVQDACFAWCKGAYGPEEVKWVASNHADKCSPNLHSSLCTQSKPSPLLLRNGFKSSVRSFPVSCCRSCDSSIYL